MKGTYNFIDLFAYIYITVKSISALLLYLKTNNVYFIFDISLDISRIRTRPRRNETGNRLMSITLVTYVTQVHILVLMF